MMRIVISFMALLSVHSTLLAEVPKSIPEEWRSAFEARPEMTEPGVYSVEKPQKALFATGRFVPTERMTDTPRNRQIGRERAELAAYSVLYAHLYERDKNELAIPDRLKLFANDAVLRDAHRRTLTIQGATVLAVWTDQKGVCCTLLITEDRVKAAMEFTPAFRTTAGSQQLKLFEADSKRESIRNAFECNPDSLQIRKAYAAYMCQRGFKVAGFLLSSSSVKLPNANDLLASFLRNESETDFKKALTLFEHQNPNLEAALDLFLAALEGQYTNPDCLNYIGICFRSLGYPESAQVFLRQAVANGPHRFATTNLGLNQLDLGRADEARKSLSDAMKHFPNEQWTAKAKVAIRHLDQPQFKDVEIEAPFKDWLTSQPLLMSNSGIKVFKIGKDKIGLVAVSAVPLKDGSPKDILRAERVSKEKALRDLVAKEVGMTIASIQVLEEKTTVTILDGKLQSKSLTEYLEWTEKNVQGVAKDMPVIGRWKSNEGDVFYLAIGVVCDSKGKPIPQDGVK